MLELAVNISSVLRCSHAPPSNTPSHFTTTHTRYTPFCLGINPWITPRASRKLHNLIQLIQLPMPFGIASTFPPTELYDLSARWPRTHSCRLRHLVWHQPTQHLMREPETIAFTVFLLRLHEVRCSHLGTRHCLRGMFPTLTGVIHWGCRVW